MPTASTQTFLDPSYLNQLQNYALMARVAVEGFLSGMHRSSFHGFGTEFLQYRNYTPGEDLKYLDWKVLAKSDRLYTKVYREETNMNCYIVLDCSGSTDYQGQQAPVSKFRYSGMIAACIAYLAAKQGDNVGLYAYNNQLREAVEPGLRSGQLNRCLQALSRLTPQGQANHEKLLTAFTQQFNRRGIVIFISDMLESEEVLPPLLKRFRFARNDCLAVQVLDPDELSLPQPQVTRFIDSESNQEIVTFPEAARQNYQKAMDRFQTDLKRNLTRSQVPTLHLKTSDSIGRTLARYLNQRERMG